MKTKKTTSCPACRVDSADCGCGVSEQARRHFAEFKRGKAEILVMPSESPDNPGVRVNAIAVVLHEALTVEQWLGHKLVSVLTVAPEGEALVWDDILDGLRNRASHRIGSALPIEPAPNAH